MKRVIPAAYHSNSRVLLSLSLSILIVVFASTIVSGQSGRRVPKRPPQTEPTPQKTEDARQESASPVEDKERTKVAVVKHLPHINSSALYTNMVVEECVARLRQAATLNVIQGKDMRRKDARDYARESEDTHVVFIQLEIDTADTDDPHVSIGPIPSRALFVEYILFEAGTGKQKATGRIYQHRSVPGGPLPGKLPTSTGDAEQRMRYAGKQAADRILDALRISLIPGK
jgi:hypothetical protein